MKGFEITDETIAFDLVKETGPGGNFLDKMNTVKNPRKEHWQPSIFNRDSYQKWAVSGSRIDLDEAKGIYYEIMKKEDIKTKINEKTEKLLLKIIHSA